MSTQDRPSCPAPRKKIVDLYFLEHRAKLLDIAAFLDRVDRAEDDGSGEDFRVAALREAVALLLDGEGQRTRRILEHLSDPTRDTIPVAGTQGADGAYRHSSGRDASS